MARVVLVVLVFALAALPRAARAETDACQMLRVPLAAGAFVTAETVANTPCRDDGPRAPLEYDYAAGAPVTTAAMPAGTYLGRLLAPTGPIAAAGKTLYLVIREGPVTIVREVQPVRAVRGGKPGFVRTGGGDVLTARFIPSEAGQ